MSGVSSTGSSTSSSAAPSQGTLGDAPPVTFPGIASGIDYNSIIEKYTAATLQQETPLQTQVAKYTAQNNELIKIQGLLSKVQDSLTALSNPATFQAYSATPSNTAAATATQTAGSYPTAGTYSIVSQVAATFSSVTADTAANGTLNAATPLAYAGTSITANNGSSGSGVLTVNGVQFNYDVTTQSITQIISNLNAISGQTHVTASYNSATGQVSLTSAAGYALAVGAASDSGNLAQVLKLDVAPISGTVATGQTETSVGTVAGINPYATLSVPASAGPPPTPAQQAGFATAVTGGTFTINGVSFTVNPNTQAVSDVIKQINSSSAGVTASWDSSNDRLVVTANTPGAQSIVIGKSTDTSNFLTAVGLEANASPAINPTVTVGTKASITFVNASGANQTVYSSTNDFTSVIPGIDIKVAETTGAYTIAVANNPAVAEKAIGAFVTAYNAAINEIDTSTVAPVVAASTDPTTGQQTSSATTTGGILYGNFQVSELRDTLVNLVSGFLPSGSSSYNSLQSIGLQLDTAYTTAPSSSSDSSSSDSQSDSSANQIQATTGKLAALDTTTFEAAFAANPSIVTSLFSGATGITDSLGSYLAQATGAPTLLNDSVVGSSTSGYSILLNIEQNNTDSIDSLNTQIKLINDEATFQANSLRAQYSASESQIAELQALQGTISSIGK